MWKATREWFRLKRTLSALGTWDPNKRAEAAKKLGEWRDARAVESLITRLKDDRDPGVRGLAGQSLGKIADTRAIGPLVNALTDGFGYVREDALNALSTIDPEWAKSDAARAAIPSLVAALEWESRASDQPPFGLSTVRRALTEIGEAAVDALVDAFQINSRARMPAMRVLRNIASQRAVDPLVDKLKRLGACPHDELIMIIEILGKTGDARAAEPIIRVIGEELRVAEEGISALENIIRNDPSNVTESGLQDLLNLDNVQQEDHMPFEPNDDSSITYRVVLRKVDCSRVSALAQQELSRRKSERTEGSGRDGPKGSEIALTE